MNKVRLQLLLVFLLALVFNSNAQVYNLGEGADTIYTCNGTLYDPGGTGNYLPNQNITQTFCPDNPGDAIQFDFTFWGFSPGTNLQVYDGGNTSAPIIGSYSSTNFPQKITGSESGGGCLTIRFTVGNSTNGTSIGFVASLQCIGMPSMLALGESNVDTLLSCNSLFKRPQSFSTPPVGNTIQHTVCPTEGNCLKFELEALEWASPVRYLKVYDGPSNAFPLVDNFSTPFNDVVSVEVRSSNDFGGCLTFETSSQIGLVPTFRGRLSCVECDTATIKIGSIDSIQLCDFYLVDPGGDGNYSNNSNLTQTICAGEDNILRAHFDFIILEENWDSLLVFSGSNTNGYLLGEFTGVVPEEELPVFTSTPLGDGCLTFRMSSDGSQVSDGFKAWIECLPRPQLNIFPAPTECDNALGLCNEQIAQFTTNTSPVDLYGTFYCLGATYNPTWFYLKSGAVGDIDVGISAETYVAYACWGPYTQEEWLGLGCNMFIINNDLYNVFNLVSCGGATPYRNVHIPDTSPGEYYVIMIISSPNSAAQNVNLFISNGTAVSCSETCSLNANLEFSSCDSLTNTYAISGFVELNGSHQSDTLTLSSSAFGMISYPVGSNNAIEVNLSGISSNGENETLLFHVNNFETCTQLVSYVAPSPCSPCAVFIENTFGFCPGAGLNLEANASANGTFVWEGPQGIVGQDSILNIPDFDNSMEGIYRVMFTDTTTGCSSEAAGFMNLISLPEIDIEIDQNQDFYCEYDNLLLYASNSYSPYDYTWTAPTSSSLQGLSFVRSNLTAADTGQYIFTQNYQGCLRQVYSLDLEVLPSPPPPSIFYVEDLDVLETDAIGGAISWYNGSNVLIEEGNNSSQLNPPSNANYYVLVTADNGCSIRSSYYYYNLTGFDDLSNPELFNIYPNPFLDEVSIVFSDGAKYESLNFFFYDQTGRLVLNEKPMATKETYNIYTRDLSQGIYLLRIMEGERLIGSFKLVKQ